jgi:hypothetical protein
MMLSLIYFNPVKSQNSTPLFPTENASWEMFVSYQESFNDAFYYFTNSRDTIMNDENYHTLFKGIPGVYSNVFGYYRVDSLKVFYKSYPVIDSTEILLYDFGVQVGDTFRLNHQGNFAYDGIVLGDFIVHTIDSMLINDSYHKKIHFFSNHDEFMWIESIGSFEGFFPFVRGFESNYGFYCFFTQGIGIDINRIGEYPNYEIVAQPCQYIDIEVNENVNVNISPNPASDYITIQSEFKNLNYELYDFSGKTILNGKVNSKIDVSQLESGIYFLRIFQDNVVIQTQKIVKE